MYIEACFAPTHNPNAWERGINGLTGKSVLEAQAGEGRGLVDGDEGARNGAQHYEYVFECVSGELVSTKVGSSGFIIYLRE